MHVPLNSIDNKDTHQYGAVGLNCLGLIIGKLKPLPSGHRVEIKYYDGNGGMIKRLLVCCQVAES